MPGNVLNPQASKATVSQATVEHAVFTIIRRHCNDTNLEQRVGLTANPVKWSATSALPAVIKHRVKQVKAIVAKAGSLDEAGQRIAELNQRDFVDSEGGSPANMLGVRLYSACKEPVKHDTGFTFLRPWPRALSAMKFTNSVSP